MAETIVDGEVVRELEPTGTALARVEAHEPVSLWRTDDPVEVVQIASKVAGALKDVAKRQGLIATIRGREHPQVEAWQLLGSMLGVHPVPVGEPVPLPWPEPIPQALKTFHDRGLTFGFTASYVAVKGGETVGGGQSRCTRSESTWKDRDDFALASMAQTRAISKALSGPLRFVMVLAGYSATPAEEMPADHEQSSGLPFGPEMDRTLRQSASSACVKFAGDRDRGGELWKTLKTEFGYMPQAAAVALVKAANAEMLMPEVKAPDPS